MQNNIEIKLSEGQQELVIRSGDALPLQEPVKIDREGNIKAPGNFARIIKPDAQKALVMFGYDKMFIDYFEDPRSAYGAEISGVLKISPDLTAFGINDAKYYTVQDLAKFLRMRKVFFTDKSEHDALINSLNKFRATINTEIEQNKDNRGNQKQLLDRKVESELPHLFSLTIPVFVGYPSFTFRVEIAFDTSDASVRLWLESPELSEIITINRNQIIDEELKNFDGLVIIQQ